MLVQQIPVMSIQKHGEAHLGAAVISELECQIVIDIRPRDRGRAAQVPYVEKNVAIPQRSDPDFHHPRDHRARAQESVFGWATATSPRVRRAPFAEMTDQIICGEALVPITVEPELNVNPVCVVDGLLVLATARGDVGGEEQCIVGEAHDVTTESATSPEGAQLQSLTIAVCAGECRVTGDLGRDCH
jgi:hypothetical protein